MVSHEETITFLRKREEEKQRSLDKLFQKARREQQRIVDYIIAEHNPYRVWQWGSLLSRKNFTEKSDIDIAVEGLVTAKEIFTIVARAEEMTRFSLDIVELDKIEPEFREVIKQKGTCIYERR